MINIPAVEDRSHEPCISPAVDQRATIMDPEPAIAACALPAQPQPARPKFGPVHWNRPSLVDLRPKTVVDRSAGTLAHRRHSPEVSARAPEVTDLAGPTLAAILTGQSPRVGSSNRP